MDRMHMLAIWLSIALLLLLLVGSVQANSDLRLRGSISSGGGQLSGPGLVLQAGIGQPIASVNAAEATLCSGLFCGPDAPLTIVPTPEPGAERVFLPTIAR